MRRLLLAAAPLAFAAPAHAQTAANPAAIALSTPLDDHASSDVRRLSPEAADAAIEAGAAEHVVDPDDIAIGAPSRGIHGEFGAEIGSGGSRAVYGAATVPLGQNGEASVAFEQSRSPRLHGW